MIIINAQVRQMELETNGLNPKARRQPKFFAQFKLGDNWWPAGEIGFVDIEGCQDFINILETSALVSGGEVFEYRIKEEEM